MSKHSSDEGRASAMSDYGRYAGVGLQFAASIGVLAWAGWWADEKLSTKPVFLIVGVLAGATGGFISLIKSVPATTGGKRRTSQGRSTKDPTADDSSSDTPPKPR